MHNAVLLLPGMKFSQVCSFYEDSEYYQTQIANRSQGIIHDYAWKRIELIVRTAIEARNDIKYYPTENGYPASHMTEQFQKAVENGIEKCKNTFNEYLVNILVENKPDRGMFHWSTIAISDGNNRIIGTRTHKENVHFFGMAIHNHKNKAKFFRVVSGVIIGKLIETSPVFPSRTGNPSIIYDVNYDAHHEFGQYYHRQIHRPFGLSIPEVHNEFNLKSVEYIKTNSSLYFTFPELFINPIGEEHTEILNNIDLDLVNIIEYIKNVDPTCLGSWSALYDKVADIISENPEEREMQLANICGFTPYTIQTSIAIVAMLHKNDISTIEVNNTTRILDETTAEDYIQWPDYN